MAKITEVTIINPSTLRLDVDAKIGDEINLLDISKIDTAFIKRIIDEAKDKEIKKQLEAQKQFFDMEKENAISQKTKELEKNNIELKSKLESLEKEVESKVKLEYEKTINELQLKIQNYINENEQFEIYKKLELSKMKEELLLKYNDQINNLKNKMNELEKELELSKINQKLKLQEELYKKELEYHQQLQEKTQIINDLKLAKSSLNVKKIGEQLESWCNMEYENYSQCGFETCTWEKDNISVKDDGDIKGTKADYIFKVYATKEMQPNELLTSVVCEMKNESPNSTNKKKNADHYAKLDKDRIKKNCEYALLISELEWDQPNDLPIKKVKEYDKMYIVRPQYFINFLSLIMTLSFKFKDLLLEDIKQQEKFKDSYEIKQEFEKFKNDLIDKPLEKLEKELNNIIANANNIKTYSDKIITSASDLINRTLENIKSRIHNFKIDKLCKKIDKLDLE